MEVLAPVALDAARMRRVVDSEGGCIVWGASVGLSPADDVLISVERPLDLDSEGQLVASVLSKRPPQGRPTWSSTCRWARRPRSGHPRPRRVLAPNCRRSGTRSGSRSASWLPTAASRWAGASDPRSRRAMCWRFCGASPTRRATCGRAHCALPGASSNSPPRFRRAPGWRSPRASWTTAVRSRSSSRSARARAHARAAARGAPASVRGSPARSRRAGRQSPSRTRGKACGCATGAGGGDRFPRADRDHCRARATAVRRPCPGAGELAYAFDYLAAQQDVITLEDAECAARDDEAANATQLRRPR